MLIQCSEMQHTNRRNRLHNIENIAIMEIILLTSVSTCPVCRITCEGIKSMQINKANK